MSMLISNPRAARWLAVCTVVVAGACAGSTLNSGVGDAMLDSAPYYAGTLSADSARIGHWPVVYQRGGSQGELFDPEAGAGSAVARLLAEMNAYLDSLQVTARLTSAAKPSGIPPDVHFGCPVDATGDCLPPERRPRDRGPLMRLAVGRPSGDWVSWAQPLMDEAGAGRSLQITLEVGQYWPRQTNWRGSKEIELGTGYTKPLPWLTSLDDPVTVLQLTGALLGRDGRAIRIGAEGLVAHRTSFLLSALGAQRIISDGDVERVRSARREDLPGQPLVWQVALRRLVAGLTGEFGI
jgi:hypothetical protein